MRVLPTLLSGPQFFRQRVPLLRVRYFHRLTRAERSAERRGLGLQIFDPPAGTDPECTVETRLSTFRVAFARCDWRAQS